MLTLLFTLTAGGLVAAYFIHRELGDGRTCLRVARTVARVHHGELIEGSESVWPMVIAIPHPSGPAEPPLRLSYLRRWTHTGIALDSTRLEMRWPPRAAAVTFRIRRRTPFLRPAGPTEGIEALFGDSAFDMDYLVETQAPGATLAEAIRGPARTDLIDLSRVHKRELLLLTSGHAGVEIVMKGWLLDQDAVRCLVALTGKLLEAATDSSRVLVLPDLPPEDFQVLGESSSMTQDTNCHVCGSPLEGTLVHCAKCEQPYHPDCWNYVGVCSTFGCGSQRTREPGTT